MHPDIQKLIDIAKESGKLTDKQKEIILSKAVKLGEDIDEVEMFLESVLCSPKSDYSVSNAEKMVKCPNCGVYMSSVSFSCPACGYVFSSESISSRSIREEIELFQNRLLKAKSDKEKAAVIRSFTLPKTYDGLMSLLSLSCSCFWSKCNNYSMADVNNPAYYHYCIFML